MAVGKFITLLLVSLVSYGEGTVSNTTSQCVPPAHIPNVKLQNEAMVLQRAKCYLSCMESEDVGIESLLRPSNTSYDPWPTYTFNEIMNETEKCSAIQRFLGCYTGCEVASTMEEYQLSACKNECSTLVIENCTAGPQVCAMEFTCSIEYNETECGVGCNLNIKGDNNSRELPPSPTKEPKLVPYSQNNYQEPGLYTIDLLESVPNNMSINDDATVEYTSFVFKVNDSVEVNYIWQKTADDVLDLTAYTCKNVTVSFAAVNSFGVSQYSPSTLITVYGTQWPPGRVQNIDITSYSWDSTSSLLHVEFTWEPPAEVNGTLRGYDITIGPAGVQQTPESSYYDTSISPQSAPNNTASINATLDTPDTQCLSFQMRARNEFLPGEWSDELTLVMAVKTSSFRTTCKWIYSAQSGWNIELLWYGVDRTQCGINNFISEFIFHPSLIDTTQKTVQTLPLLNWSATNSHWYFFEKYPQVDEDHYYKFEFMAKSSDSASDHYPLGSCSVIATLLPTPTPTPIHTSIPTSIYNTPVSDGLIPPTDTGRGIAGYIYGIIGACVVAFIAVMIIIVIVILQYKLRKRKRQLQRIMEDPGVDSMFMMGPKRSSPKSLDPFLQTDEWEIPPNQVIVEDCLGEGAFGEVYKGVVRGPISNPKIRRFMKTQICITVAIKLLKTSARGNERSDFLKEIEMMKKVTEGQNSHVVGMIGCVTIQEPLCLITEFVKYGDLLSYLRTTRKQAAAELLASQNNPYLNLGDITAADLTSFAYQIASGMQFLSSLGIVHRDLACRNVLVGEGKVLKITDFGMSRETDEVYVQKTKGRVPLKWMAIESIVDREFTTASDVWSYGITLWEITTMGGFPYPSIMNEELLPLLRRGYRMEKPDNCAPEVYDIMIKCWNENPQKRPSFTNIRDKFDSMLLDGRRDAYIAIQMDHDKPYYKADPGLEDSSHLRPLSAVIFHDGSQASLSVPGSPLTSHKSSQQPLLCQSRSPSISPTREKAVRSSSMIIERGEQKENKYVDSPSRNTATALLLSPHPTRVRRASDGSIRNSPPHQPPVQIMVTKEV